MSDSTNWPHSKSVPVLLRKAAKDSDPVSMFTTGRTEAHEDLAVVVIDGHQPVRMFREWATRNKILTGGKSVEGSRDD